MLSDVKKRRNYDATGEADFADFDIDEFLDSGALGDFFQEMMAESGFAKEMIGDFGGDMDSLQAKKHSSLTYGRNGVATYGRKGCWDSFLVLPSLKLAAINSTLQ